MSYDAVLKALQAFFSCHQDGISCVYLYGSLARREDRRDSDIDIAVLYEKTPPATLEGLGLELSGALERLLRRPPVDLVVLNRAPVDLIHRILRDGILIYEHDRSAHTRFEVKARNEYFDLLPYLRQYRRAAREQRT